jgi:hypothetical protein
LADWGMNHRQFWSKILLNWCREAKAVLTCGQFLMSNCCNVQPGIKNCSKNKAFSVI